MLKGKKYQIICGTRLKSGDFITYDGSCLSGYGIADYEDLDFIQNNLDVCLEWGNVFDDTVDIDGIVDELICNGTIGQDDVDETKSDIQKEIEEFFN